MAKLEIGSPIIEGGKYLKEEDVAAVFTRDTALYPLTIYAENFVARDLSFPELVDAKGSGLFLTNIHEDPDHAVSTVYAKNFDVLVRCVSSIQQIAELNNYPLCIRFSDEKPAKIVELEAIEANKAAEQAKAEKEAQAAAEAIKAAADAEAAAEAAALQAKAEAAAAAEAAVLAEQAAAAEAATKAAKAGK
jgi:hypothetical protein